MPYIMPNQLDEFTLSEARQYVESSIDREVNLIEHLWRIVRWQTFWLVNVQLPKKDQIKDYTDMLILPSDNVKTENEDHIPITRQQMDEYFENDAIKKMNDHWDEMERQKNIDNQK